MGVQVLVALPVRLCSLGSVFGSLSNPIVLHFLVPDQALLSCLDSASDPQQDVITFTADHPAASQHHILPDALYWLFMVSHSLFSSGLPQMQATSSTCPCVSVASLCSYIETVFARAASEHRGLPTFSFSDFLPPQM